MIKKIVIVFFLGVNVFSAFCQTHTNNAGISTMNDVTANPGMVIDDLPLPPANIIGNAYLNENWISGNVKLKKNEINNCAIRFDLNNKYLEIKSGADVKVCNLNLLKSFEYVDANSGDKMIFVNCDQFKFKNNQKLLGILEVIQQKKISFYSHPYTVTIENSYNEKLAVGSRNDTIIKKERFYIGHNGVLVEAPKTSKEAEALFPEFKQEINTFYKGKKVNLKSRNHINSLVTHLNDISK